MTTTYPSGTPCWVDLGTADPDAAERFYVSVLGWSALPADDGYRLCRHGDGFVAALGLGEDPGVPYWTTNVSVDDLELSLVAIGAAGGTAVVGPTEAGEHGRFAVTTDPGGAPLSLWQPGTFPGAEVRGVAGTWTGLHLFTDEVDQQAGFYREALGWLTSGEGTTSSSWLLPDSSVVTVGPPPATWTPPRPSLWLVTFGAAELDRACVAVEAAGGQVREELATATGPLRVATDDQGAAFGLRQA